MRIALVKENKNHEYRVALLPEQVALLHQAGHLIEVESAAGQGIGISDQEYEQAGASIVPSHERHRLWQQAELILKVKEPSLEEASWLHGEQILFTYLHLAPLPELTQALLSSGVTALAYETLSTDDGYLPLLAPMSIIAGRLAAQVGAQYLQSQYGGSGQLLASVMDLPPARVDVLGAGVVGSQAALVAAGMGAEVHLWDISQKALDRVASRGMNAKLHLLQCELDPQSLSNTSLLIGAVLVPGGSAPKLIKPAHLEAMPAKSVFVDVAIDQGGCSTSSRVTSHDQPTYWQHGVQHYCVANMPGIVASTASKALSAATFPYVQQLAEQGMAALAQPELQRALNIHQGHCYQAEVAKAQGLALKTWAD